MKNTNIVPKRNGGASGLPYLSEKDSLIKRRPAWESNMLGSRSGRRPLGSSSGTRGTSLTTSTTTTTVTKNGVTTTSTTQTLVKHSFIASKPPEPTSSQQKHSRNNVTATNPTSAQKAKPSNRSTVNKNINSGSTKGMNSHTKSQHIAQRNANDQKAEVSARNKQQAHDKQDHSESKPIQHVARLPVPDSVLENFEASPFQPDHKVYRQYEHNYAEIDQRALSIPKSEESTLEKCAQYLTSPYNTIEEKARALYRWITNNIRYDVEGLYSGKMSYTSTSAWQSRKAVCSGYSDLFKEMCKVAGISDCVSINGYAKGASYEIGKPISSTNHAWTAIKTEDGQWHLIEATWGAGYVNGKSFTARFVDRYFFMSPYEFIAAHFPSDNNWQLLPTPVSKSVYEDRVCINATGFNFGLASVSHHKGYNILKKSNVEEVVMKALPGTKWLFNLREADGGSPLFSNVNPIYSENGDTAHVKIFLPKKNVEYQLLVFVGREANGEKDWGCTYVFKVIDSASMDLSGFPLVFPKMGELGFKLIEPSFGKLKRNSEYTFKIEAPSEKCDMAMYMSIDSDMRAFSKKDGSSIYTLTTKMPSKTGHAIVFAGQGHLDGLLQYTVE
ncbi:hypothetical protein C9374_002845 [Naegleria lovaniensis]|uniref:Transglutaminase-like domain-containing protein n=1 Tax=Naegleria lovaniensis TaxID=51637 RepID=A0AA88GUH9_NAELO|nr:uncharacterized protein C9374_002845 [Naegleria lovaniensis]KAG2386399.1 hypothetical protein C9374_002845 [Naegleria lovaniensis]